MLKLRSWLKSKGEPAEAREAHGSEGERLAGFHVDFRRQTNVDRELWTSPRLSFAFAYCKGEISRVYGVFDGCD